MSTISNNFLKIALIVLLAMFFSTSSMSQAAENKNASSPEDILKSLDQIERDLNKEAVKTETLEGHLKTLPKHKSWATQCQQTQEEALKDLQKNLTALGEQVKGEPKDVTDKRNSIKANQASSEKLLATCKLILLRSGESLDKINKFKQSQLAEKYFFKGPSFVKLAEDNWNNPGIWLTASRDFILKNSGLDKININQFTVLLVVLALTILLALFIRKSLSTWLQTQPIGDTRSALLGNALAQTSIRYAKYLLPSLAAAAYLYTITKDITPVPFISILAYGLPIVILCMSLIQLFLSSSLQLNVIKAEQASTARKLSHRLMTLVLIIFLGYLIFSTILSQSLPEPALLLTRGIYGAVVIINLIMVIWLVGRFNRARSNQLFRAGIILLLLCALIAELYGYRNISAYILRTVLGTLIAFDIFKLLDILLSESLDRLETGEGRWQQKLHLSMGLKPEQTMPGIIWVRIIFNLLLWTGLIAALLYIWKVPDTYIQTMVGYISTGFNIGSFEVLPIRFLQAIVILPVLLTINAWFRKGLEHRWLTRTQMERGTRESMAKITGYIGVSVAIIISLSVAGMDFSKLALIAGALSVGIGFGLQNIVNNFVSGLILLFERPIKTGDWIQVGTVEGYVRKISIRSTQIQTFDKSDVIVPNSDLIAGTVTNLMLHDQRGRIRVPVGVAYGSNTELVKELLLQVANEHEQVLKNPMLAPAPAVLFLGFGDSALNFELRCHINNIDTRFITTSELNFAIDALFREHGVQIPFPQRDLHIRDMPTEPRASNIPDKKIDPDSKES